MRNLKGEGEKEEKMVPLALEVGIRDSEGHVNPNQVSFRKPCKRGRERYFLLKPWEVSGEAAETVLENREEKASPQAELPMQTKNRVICCFIMNQ